MHKTTALVERERDTEDDGTGSKRKSNDEDVEIVASQAKRRESR